MRILTRDEIRAVENRAFDGLFTEAQLMERAGLACADKMLALYGDQMKGQPVAVVCGNGKNAGDGFVIARAAACCRCARLYCAGRSSAYVAGTACIL